MSSSAPPRQVRISNIAGRFLVFDIQDVGYIRRHHDTCAVAIGTMPQAPTQNLFLSLPVELYAEEAKLLVEKKVAYIAAETTAHIAALTAMDGSARKIYLHSLSKQRKTAQRVLDQERKAVAKKFVDRRSKKRSDSDETQSLAAVATGASESTTAGSDSLRGTLNPNPPVPVSTPASTVTTKKDVVSITPTTSAGLVGNQSHVLTPDSPPRYPLLSYLNSRGYFITPGLRFGGHFSAYPGDPFRYHAHFIVNSYAWKEELPLLDIVVSGRLGTLVKKSFLIGGETSGVGDDVRLEGDARPTTAPEIRVFSIEWAGM